MDRPFQKFQIVLEYEGTQYCGWQYQPNGLSVQEVLEKKLEKITKKKVIVIGAGRTDSGVHAQAQVAHFRTDSRMTPRQFLKALNSLLPHDIVVHKVENVRPEFHARKSATWKIYQYSILNRDFPSALNFRQAHYIATRLDLTSMRRAARHLIGRHDFTSFRAADCEAATSVRQITQLTLSRKDDYIRITVKGTGFLKHMVRIIVGTLIEVGYGRMAPDEVRRVLRARDRNLAGPTAPARGLCLVKVAYGKNRAPLKKG